MHACRYILIAISLATASACSYLPFAGGALDGTLAAPRADWRSVADVQIIQLETRPQDPYSVKLWMIAEEKQLFVYAGDEHSQWAQNIDSNANVRLKVEDTLYELAATRVTDQAEFQRFARAWLAKYSSDRTDSRANDTYLYRLAARPPPS